MREVICRVVLLGIVVLAVTGCQMGGVTIDDKKYCISARTMALSPDGRTLAIAAPDPRLEHLFLVDIKSRRVQRLTDVDCDAYPAWSPSGTTIALIHDDSEIALVDRDGQNRRNVSGSFVGRNSLQWKNANTLVYGIDDKDGPVGDVSHYVGELPAAGGKATHPIHHARYPALSPDGRRIAYLSDNRNDLYIAQYPFGAPHLLLHDRDMSQLAWSPDGRWIAFNSGNDLHVVAVNGHETKIPWRDSHNPVWHDSRHLLLVSHDTVFEADIRNRSMRPIVDTATLHTRAVPTTTRHD